MKALIGAHASISKGILNSIKYIESIGGNCLQIFLGSNQSTSLKMKTKITDKQINEVRRYLKEKNIILVIHTVYLLNFCNHPPTNKQIKYALDNLIFDLELTGKLGGIGCVLHIGYKKELNENEAYKNMVNNVKYAIDITQKDIQTKKVKIILETPAGKGSQIGTTLEEFTKMWNMFPKSYINSGRLGICVDTAHIFSSGRAINNVKGTKKYLSDFNKLIGKKHIILFHINDSKAVCNSRKDLHEGLGEGYIYGKDKGGTLLALKEIWKYASKNKIPMILETHGGGGINTPKDNGRYEQEIQLFRKWDNGRDAEKSFKLTNLKIKSKSTKSTKSTKSNNYSKENKKSSSKQNQQNQNINYKKTKYPLNYKTYSINKKIVKIFTELADIYDSSCNNIRRNAYQKAVYKLKRYPKKITESNKLLEIDGIGKKMVMKIEEILNTGHLKLLDDFKKDNKIKSINKKLELERILGIGRQKAIILKEKYGIQTISQLKKRLGSKTKKLK